MGNRQASSDGGAATSYAANNLNQITQTSIGGNATAITYDANGNTLALGAKTFGYNDADQLTSVVVPGEKKSEFVYDSDGRKRISKEYDWDAAANDGAGGWTQSDETRFVYDGMDLVQERGADGTVKASYVRDGNIGGVLSRTTPDGTFYYHYDGGGNVVAMTDANENIVAQYSYDAFGNTLSATGAQAEANPFRFSSKYYDGDTGLYDYGYRHYDSSLGRWINRDPIAESGGLNLYGMVGNNPVNSIDKYGLLAADSPNATVQNALRLAVTDSAGALAMIQTLRNTGTVSHQVLDIATKRINLIAGGASRYASMPTASDLIKYINSLGQANNRTMNKAISEFFNNTINKDTGVRKCANDQLRKMLPKDLTWEALRAYLEVSVRALNNAEKATKTGKKVQNARIDVILDLFLPFRR